MKTPFIYAAMALIAFAGSASATTYSWVNAAGGTSGTLTTSGANWSGGSAPGSSLDNVLVFNTTQNSFAEFPTADFQLNQLTVSGNSTKGITISGTTGGYLEFVKNSSGTLPVLVISRPGTGSSNISVPMTITDMLTIQANGVANISGAMTNNGGIVVTGTTAFTWSSVISGSGTVQLNTTNTTQGIGAANSYTGATILTGGTLNITKLANGGANSSIGASTNVASNLVLDGGALMLSGTLNAGTTDRLFTLTQNGGTISSSGSFNSTGTLTVMNFTNTGAIAFTGSGARTLTLTGTNAGANKIAAIIGDGAGGSTSVAKTGVGEWGLSGANTYTGGTTVSAGTLIVSNATGSATGAGNFTLNHGATLTGTGVIASSGAGSTNTINGNVIVGNGGTADVLTMTASTSTTFANASLTFNLGTGGGGTTLGNSSVLALGATPSVVFDGSGSGLTLTLNLVGGSPITDLTQYVLFTSTDSSDAFSFANGITLSGSNVISGVNLVINSAQGSTFYQNSYLQLVSVAGGYNIDVEVVPEPGTWALMLGGLAFLVVFQRARRQKNG